MPKNKVNDLITDQEITFALLVLSGTMTDRQAAEAAGLNPDSAAYTKAKPRVQAYMLEHRAAVEQKLVQQETEERRRLNLEREKVLARLWEIAYLSPETTRGNMNGQLKALSLIAAMQNFISDRRAAPGEKKPAPVPVKAEIYQAAWLREQKAATQATTIEAPQPTPTPQEDSPGVPAPEPAAGSVAEALPAPVPSQPAFAHRVPQADGVSPYVPQSAFVPDTRVPFSLRKNPFSRYR